jgi:hypothetical protein
MNFNDALYWLIHKMEADEHYVDKKNHATIIFDEITRLQDEVLRLNEELIMCDEKECYHRKCDHIGLNGCCEGATEGESGYITCACKKFVSSGKI